jgi:hypothetical protein
MKPSFRTERKLVLDYIAKKIGGQAFADRMGRKRMNARSRAFGILVGLVRRGKL